MAIIRRNTVAIEEARQKKLADIRASAKSEINTEVGIVREKFITPISGQEMIYQAKEEEARRYLASDPRPETLDGFPFIAAETGILAPTAEDVAVTWISMGVYWRSVAASLEAIRMTATNQISVAETQEAIAAIVDAFRQTARSL